MEWLLLTTLKSSPVIKILLLQDFWKVSTAKMIKILSIDLLNVQKCMTLLQTMRFKTDQMCFYEML